jgi:hypothetical protein
MSRFLSALLVTFCFTSIASAHENTKALEKWYLPSSQIQISHDKIIVKQANKEFYARALHCDKRGVYVYKKDLSQEVLKWRDDAGDHQRDAYSNCRRTGSRRR